MNEKEERRLNFLRADKEMFGLTGSEESELKRLEVRKQK